MAAMERTPARVLRALALVALCSAPLRAQERGALAIAQAETLFREGKSLMDRRRFDEACPKLAESHRLAPGGGTVLTLALCYEDAGKLASAWATFFEASRLATRDGRDDRRTIANRHRDALEPQLSRVEIRLPAGLDRGAVELSMDGQSLSLAVVGVPTPVDPGSHTIRLQAPGKIASDRRFEIGPRRDLVTVVLGPLEDAAPPVPAASSAPVAAASAPLPPPPPPAIPPPSAAGARLPVGVGLVAVGLVGVGLGSYLGLRAQTLNDQALDRCPQSPCSDQGGLQKNRDAVRMAQEASLAFGLGLAAGAVGGYLWLTAPRTAVAIEIHPTGAALRYRF
jgi:hypothetical protein